MGDRAVHPLSPGPVFVYEWIASSRRWQGYAVRSLVVLTLLAALTVIWNGQTRYQAGSVLNAQARLGEMFYLAVAGTQLTLVLLAAPAATAGAICLDRARGTLTHLLMTDLSDGEIVLGKFAARLVPVLGLIGCSMPVMAILTLMGGVDPDALFGAFVVMLGVAVLGCGMALAFSLWVGKSHEALMGTYAVWGLWLLAAPMGRTLSGATGFSIPIPPRTADPFYLTFAPYWYPGQVGWGDYLWFLGATWAIAAVLTAAAVFRLRPVCLTDRGRGTGRSSRVSRFGGRFDLTRLLPGPTLDFNPVLWREWHRNRPSGWALSVIILYVMLAVTFSVLAVATKGVILAVLVNGFQVSIGLLMLSVSASTSLSEERARGSLDILMATPLSSREIVLGKWLGSFRAVPLLAVLPTLVALGGAGWQVREWPGVFVMAVYVVACGAAVTSLGLAVATWCPRLGRAIGLTVAAYVLVTVGWMFLVMGMMGPEPYGIAVISASPFYGPIAITVELYESRARGRHFMAVFLWALAYAAVAAVLLAATLSGFNRRLGRVETGGRAAGSYARGRFGAPKVGKYKGSGPVEW